MYRFSLSLLFICFFFCGLNAQTDNALSSRRTMQPLSPAAAKLDKETKEVESFARKLTALKTSFAEKDASRIVAYEAQLLRAMRNEIDQLTEEIALAPTNASAPTQVRLEKMNSILEAFEAHAFDPAKPEAAARDFANLDEFLKMMQEALHESK